MKKTILFSVLFLVAGLARAADPIGLVVALQGGATATPASGGAARELAMQSDIFLNDTVTTGPKSRLQIMLSDDSLIAQGEQSEMTIDEYIYNPAQASDNAFGAKLGKGLFRTVTGKITDLNPDRFAVKTSRATIGIRGCDLGFNITPSEDNISILAIPAGKQIFIDPVVGDQSLLVESPSFVTVDDRGMIEQRDLTSADRSAAQQGTTPGATAPVLDPADAGADGSDILGGGLSGDQGSLIDDGGIIQNTEQESTEQESEDHSHPYIP
jgi:hypothetical protein